MYSYRNITLNTLVITFSLLVYPSYSNDLCDIEVQPIQQDIEFFNRSVDHEGRSYTIDFLQGEISECIYYLAGQYLESLYGNNPDDIFLSEYALYYQIHPINHISEGQINEFDEYNIEIMSDFLGSSLFQEMDDIPRTYYEFFFYENLIGASDEYDVENLVRYIEAMSELAPYNIGARSQYIDFILNGEFLDEEYWVLRKDEYILLDRICGHEDIACREKLNEYIEELGIQELNLLLEVACQGIVVIQRSFYSLNVC